MWHWEKDLAGGNCTPQLLSLVATSAHTIAIKTTAASLLQQTKTCARTRGIDCPQQQGKKRNLTQPGFEPGPPAHCSANVALGERLGRRKLYPSTTESCWMQRVKLLLMNHFSRPPFCSFLFGRRRIFLLQASKQAGVLHKHPRTHTACLGFIEKVHAVTKEAANKGKDRKKERKKECKGLEDFNYGTRVRCVSCVFCGFVVLFLVW